MPCYDSRSDCTGKSRELERQDEEIHCLHKRCDKLARLLCSLCASIEGSDEPLGYLIENEPELKRWWREHKALDKKRRGRKL